MAAEREAEVLGREVGEVDESLSLLIGRADAARRGAKRFKRV